MAVARMVAAREKRKAAKNPPVTKYNLDPTTPVHRQSLATVPAPVMVEDKQPKTSPHLRYAIPDQPQRSEPSLNRNKSEHKGQSDWMVPFCHNPEGDHETVFTGIFAPCILYGRTHWRLKNVALGKDPHNFESSNSCNSMCWIHGAMTVAGFGLTLIQRARIRAQYRIQGSVGNDFIKACFCGPCAMMQHDREVRAREGQVGLAKYPDHYREPEMAQAQPISPKPMKYALHRTISAEEPGVEDRVYRQPSKKLQKGKLQKRFTDSELQEVPAEAIQSTCDSSCQASSDECTSNCEAEALKNHVLMEPHKRAINSLQADACVGKVDGATSSKQKTRLGSGRNSLDSLTSCSTLVGGLNSRGSSINDHHLKVKGCEKLSRMPARRHLSYVHEFSDYSAAKMVLDHYAEEERGLQEKGTVRCLAHFSEENTKPSVLKDVTVRSTRSSSSNTIRQHTFEEDVAEIPTSEIVDQPRVKSVDSAWLLDIPIQHRISSCYVIPKTTSSIRESLRQHRVASCPPASPSTPGMPVTPATKDRKLNATVETAPPSCSSSSSVAMHKDVSACVVDTMEDSDLSTPLTQYSQYCHLLDESTLKPNSLVLRSPSKYRASSWTAPSPTREQHSLEGCPALSGDSSPVLVKQPRISSCCASLPSGSMTPNNENEIEVCNFTTGSSIPVPTKQHILASCTIDSSPSTRKSSAAMAYLMEDGCLLSRAASPVKQHRIASSGGSPHGGNTGSMSSGSSTPKPRQHRAVSCFTSSTVAECDEHLLDDCEYDSKIASPLLQHKITDCDRISISEEERRSSLAVLEEEQEHLLEDCAADSGPSSPLRQHRIASCVVSSPSSSRNSVVEQHRIASCPVIMMDEASRSQSISRDAHHLSRGIHIDASENDESIQSNYEDCVHVLDDCLTPADRVKMEANASQDTEHEKYSMRIAKNFNNQANEFNEKATQEKAMRGPRLNDIASHMSDAEFTLGQVLSLEEENNLISVTRLDGDGTMSIASRKSVAPSVPFPSPADAHPSPITPLNISGAYPLSITPLSIVKGKDRKRIASDQSSGGSGFASYFGFGSSKKTQGLVNGIGGGIIRRVENGSGSRMMGMGLRIVEPISFEELELEEIWW